MSSAHFLSAFFLSILQCGRFLLLCLHRFRFVVFISWSLFTDSVFTEIMKLADKDILKRKKKSVPQVQEARGKQEQDEERNES